MGTPRGSPGPCRPSRGGLRGAATASGVPLLPLLLFDISLPAVWPSLLRLSKAARGHVDPGHAQERGESSARSKCLWGDPASADDELASRGLVSSSGPVPVAGGCTCATWLSQVPPALSPDNGVMGVNRGSFLLWVLHASSTEWAHRGCQRSVRLLEGMGDPPETQGQWRLGTLQHAR